MGTLEPEGWRNTSTAFWASEVRYFGRIIVPKVEESMMQWLEQFFRVFPIIQAASHDEFHGVLIILHFPNNQYTLFFGEDDISFVLALCSAFCTGKVTWHRRFRSKWNWRFAPGLPSFDYISAKHAVGLFQCILILLHIVNSFWVIVEFGHEGGKWPLSKSLYDATSCGSFCLWPI